MTNGEESKRSSANRIAVRLLLIGFIAITAFVVYSLIAPIQPFHPRRDTLLNCLKAIAKTVNVYRDEHHAMPRSLDVVDIPKDPFGEGYRLTIMDDRSFLVVANFVFAEDDGSQFHYACDEKLEIKKVPQ